MDYILVDTNILLRRVESEHPNHSSAYYAIVKLLSDGYRLCVLPQILIEFWGSATRPIENNGLGWTAQTTEIEITRLETTFVVLEDTSSIFPIWREIVRHHSVLGKNVHDARIAAAMKAHNVSKLLTFNTRDFKRYTDITLIDPDSLLASDIVEE